MREQGAETFAPLEVEIESLAFGGEGITRVDGKVRFVPGALPGERVLARTKRVRRSYDRMSLERVMRPSPDRRLPHCMHSHVCGGCSLQELRYERQLAAKAAQVRELLARIGGVVVPELSAPLPSPVLRGYRNKMEFTFAARPWDPAGPPAEALPGPALGLHVPGRFDAVFDLEECALPGGAAVRAVAATRRFARERGLTTYRTDTDAGTLRHLVVREGKNTGEVLVALVVREKVPGLEDLAARLEAEVPGLVGVVLIVNRSRATVARGEEEEVLSGRPYFHERLLGLQFELSAQSFFQTNTWGAEVLIGALRRLVPEEGGRILDLYCGAGTLGLALSSGRASVVGVEQVESAVADATANAARNGITNTRFLRADAEEWITRPEASPGRFDGVIVDPPRAGMHPKALAGIIALAPRWIAYVSCNPSTLARDAARLRDSGYGATVLQIVDLFPHTAHVESVARFDRA